MHNLFVYTLQNPFDMEGCFVICIVMIIHLWFYMGRAKCKGVLELAQNAQIQIQPAHAQPHPGI